MSLRSLLRPLHRLGERHACAGQSRLHRSYRDTADVRCFLVGEFLGAHEDQGFPEQGRQRPDELLQIRDRDALVLAGRRFFLIGKARLDGGSFPLWCGGPVRRMRSARSRKAMP